MPIIETISRLMVTSFFVMKYVTRLLNNSQLFLTCPNLLKWYSYTNVQQIIYVSFNLVIILIISVLSPFTDKWSINIKYVLMNTWVVLHLYI